MITASPRTAWLVSRITALLFATLAGLIGVALGGLALAGSRRTV